MATRNRPAKAGQPDPSVLRSQIAAYQANPRSSTLWAPVGAAFVGLRAGLLRQWHRALGGREDGCQIVDLALVRAVKKFDPAKEGASPAVEIWADVLDELRPLLNRGAAHLAATVPLERDDRIVAAEQEDAGRPNPYEMIEQATRDGWVKPIVREMILLRYRDELPVTEIAKRLGLSYDVVQRGILRGLERAGGAAKRKAHKDE